MISSRRKAAKKEKTADVSVAAGRAKRKAAQDAKRGISSSGKASKMQIDKEVKKQEVKTAKTKAKKIKEDNKKGVTAKLPPKLKQEARQNQREINKIVKSASSLTKTANAVAATPMHGKAPSKKAVSAAVQAMKKEGFTIPEGLQMVITFAPKEATQRAIQNTSKQPPNKGNQKPAAQGRGARRGGNRN